MTTSDTRTPDEVSRSIAELMGWKRHGSHWDRPDGAPIGTDYYHDLNALRDGPEAKLREAGYTLIVGQHDGWYAVWSKWDVLRHNEIKDWEADGPTEAAARALAAEAALKAMQYD